MVLRHKVNFNSIKVRLEQSKVLFPIDPSTFQFHKGTIRTINPYFALGNINSFQFHKGTIRTHPDGLDDFTTQISIP